MRKLRILVTGGAGFIGSHLATALVDAGHETIIYDNFSRFGEEKLDHIKDRVRILRGDIRDLAQLLGEACPCDFVVHLAAFSRVDPSVEAFLPTFETNVTGFLNVLEYCRRFGSRLIFASSWMVYDPEEAAKKKPLSEDTKTRPITHYGLSKLIGEQYCDLFYSFYRVPSIVLRFSNVYGPGDKERLIPTLISKAKRGDDMRIFGKEQTLNYINVSDVVQAIQLSMSTDTNMDIYNIGTDRSVKLVDLASLIVSMTDSKSRLIVDPPRPFDYEYFQPDITKSKRFLHHKPSVDLEVGIKECLNYY